MSVDSLDETDAAILNLLASDARNQTAADIASEVDVTANTVRNRIDRLEDRGILSKYVPVLDYEEIGLQLRVLMICTAPVPDRTSRAKEAMEIDGVIDVREIMTGQRNVHVTAVASESEKITAVANRLTELGLTIESENLIKNTYVHPFNHQNLLSPTM